MIELAFHDMLWCPWNGHPVLVLEAKGRQQYFAVSITAEDAQALAIVPHGEGAARARTIRLVADALASHGSRVSSVTLSFGAGDVMHAHLTIEASDAQFALPAYFADGLVVARQNEIPLLMTEEAYRQVGKAALPAPPSFARRGDEEEQPMALEPYRQFIESLDLSELGGSASSGP